MLILALVVGTIVLTFFNMALLKNKYDIKLSDVKDIETEVFWLYVYDKKEEETVKLKNIFKENVSAGNFGDVQIYYTTYVKNDLGIEKETPSLYIISYGSVVDEHIGFDAILNFLDPERE